MDNRLESIELQGLKTFATTTRLEFPGRITAIVGPNGSGKSNIADAIRWVLGEQSFSLLRAKKTEDMIFSGSQQRSRAGMASATITFNNSDGWLPIDFSHVAITRQAYRDGQNEYLLNGQKVRLRDITEMLSQTGLSERTYTIIGQGLVDVALALKPDERRKLFEEAAGIGLYRSRKEEALRRLETTRKNLDRVLDILSEIKPRLRSLEKQAEKYQDYQHLESDLLMMLKEWYGFKWYQKQQDLKKISTAYQDQEARLFSLRKKFKEAENKVEQTRHRLQDFRKKLEENHGELSENHRRLENITREIAIIEERQRSLEQQKGHLTLDLSNQQEELIDLESQRVSFEKDLTLRRDEYQSATEEVNSIAQKLTHLTEKIQKLEEAINVIRQKRLKLETENVQRTAQIDELHHRIDNLQEEQEKIQLAIDHFMDESNRVNQKITQQNIYYQEISDQSGRVHKEYNQIKEHQQKLHDDLQSIGDQLNSKGTQFAKLATQLSVLEQAEAALSGYSEGSKILVEISRKGQLPKGIEPLSQFIVVEEKFEKAISAALGELTDLLILPATSKDIVIEYLEHKEIDRVALMASPENQLNTDRTRLNLDNDVFGYANDLIKVNQAYQRLIDILFSEIIIVKDAQTAQKLHQELDGMLKIVTLSGLVFQPNGVMIKGQNPSGKRIGRTRQLEELKEDVANLEKEIKGLNLTKANINVLINQIDSEIKTLSGEIIRIEGEKEGIFRELQVEKNSLLRIEEQLTWHKNRLDEVTSNIQAAQLQLHKDETSLQQVTGEIAAISADEKAQNMALSEMPLFEVQQEYNHWQTHQLVAKNVLNTADERFREISKRSENTKQRLETFEDRLLSVSQNISEIGERLTVLKEQEQGIKQVIKTIQEEKVQPLTIEREKSEKSVLTMQELEAHTRQEVIVAERQHTQLQLELERSQDQLNLLLDRVKDDLGLVAFDHDSRVGGANPLPFADDLVENLPKVHEIPESLENDIQQLKSQLRRLGAVNPEAQQEYVEVKDRFEYLNSQTEDLEQASLDLKEVINTLDEMMERDFLKTFKSVNHEFSSFFSRLFNGGDAKLVFTDQDNPVEGGVDIEARLPGRRQQGLALLSGGERSLTAAALIFALLKVSPPPFCILDEVDAMLDESNVGRFIEELRQLAKEIQVVIITHNRNTVQAADVIYGVTMGRDSTSQMISLKLEDVGDAYFK